MKRTKTRFDVMDVPRNDQENENVTHPMPRMRLMVAAGLLMVLAYLDRARGQ